MEDLGTELEQAPSLSAIIGDGRQVQVCLAYLHRLPAPRRELAQIVALDDGTGAGDVLVTELALGGDPWRIPQSEAGRGGKDEGAEQDQPEN